MKTTLALKKAIRDNLKESLNINLTDLELTFPPDPKMGDYSFACFSLAKTQKENPALIAKQLAVNFKKNILIKEVRNIGPYLNIFVSDQFLTDSLKEINSAKNFGQNNLGKGKKILIEYSGPNTNKPQHIGHLRNNCLGQALVNLYRLNGYKVIATNIINDRGIHIVKSMLAWQEFGQGETPQSSGLKGDHLVGKYYVKFGQILKEEKEKYFKEKNIDLEKLNNLERKKTEEDFLQHSHWMTKARIMLRAWENNDPKVKKLWQKMNNWVYKGYEETYKNLGIKFDHIDYESETYSLGKKIVQEGLKQKLFYQKKDSSIWIDLTDQGLDEKLLLRNDGTSVYLTQDLGTAVKRYKKFKFDRAIYIVANEQDYHFKVLFLVLKKMSLSWADKLYHLSYGMVSRPDGRIKSREGKTADADQIMTEIITRAEKIISQAQKQIKTSTSQKKKIAKIVGLGAIKFAMVGTNPQKDIIFKPEESISFDGYTGTFVQYTHARIATLLAKSKTKKYPLDHYQFNPEENKLIKLLLSLPEILAQAVQEKNPAVLTQYLFELAKNYNNFYQLHPILNAPQTGAKLTRLNISLQTKKALALGLNALGIEAPDKM
ncbi:MAG: arginine--tRNA ligase [Patescibacteria group bacterium]|nr:arginine--tRNA ligase [Patescibacteria group bacterium]